METDIGKHLAKTGFVTSAYSLYGGSSGFQLMGPNGVKLYNNIVNVWRDMFVNSEKGSFVSEMTVPTIVPEEILVKSGHVDRFTDFVMYDKSGKAFRVDHLLEHHGIDPGGMTSDQMASELRKLEDTLPDKIDHFKDVNLMFKTDRGYLRPELAQGLVVHFKEGYQWHKQFPFGLAHIGTSYRNEIATSPFTRLREFHQAEVEYFFDPLDVSHELFDLVKDMPVTIQPAIATEPTEIKTRVEQMTIEHLVNTYVKDNNQIVGYYLGQLWAFALRLGLDPLKLRLRQHYQTEMAHYASDCWDLEAETSLGWIELAGCANRTDYDSKIHQVTMSRKLETPKKTTILLGCLIYHV